MKTTKFFFALLTVAILASCSKEDDVPPVDDSLLLGEWNLEEYIYSGTSSVSQGGTTMTISFVGEFYDIDARLILNSDNTYRTEGSYVVELTSTMEGQTFTENRPSPYVEATGTYRIENSTLITGDNQVQQPGDVNMTVIQGTIAELTANRLVIVFDQDFVSGTEGAQLNISVEGQQVYSR